MKKDISLIKNNAFLRWLLLLPFVGIVFIFERLGELLKPKIGVAENVKVHSNTSADDGTSFLTIKNEGRQYCTYYIQGRKYFRFSFTKKIFNVVILNVRLGTKQNTQIFKIILKWL